MKLFALCPALVGLLLLSSCEKHSKLLEEVKRIDEETKRSYAELAAIDAKTHAYGGDADVGIMTLEQQNAGWMSKNTVLEAELADLNKRCAEGEAAIKEIRPKVDAYKAKYLR